MNMAEGLLPKVLMTSALSQEKDSETLRALGGFLPSLCSSGDLRLSPRDLLLWLLLPPDF